MSAGKMWNYFQILSTDPIIIVRSIRLGQYLIENLPDRPVTHWVLIPFYLINKNVITDDADSFKKERPDDTIYYFYNDESTYHHLRNKGLNLIGSPLESMFDLDSLSIKEDIEKEFDALMIARSVPLKRIELSEQIKSLRILTSIKDQEYYDKLKIIFGDRIVAERLNKSEMNIIYNKAKTGLCLSSSEGAQRSAMEQQMAGVPLVCTTSKGGRGRFINVETCLIVPPDPYCVEKGVEHLISLKFDPQFVRDIMLKKVGEYRMEILNLGESIMNKHGSYDFAAKIHPIMKKHHSISTWCNNVETKIKELYVD